MTTSSYCKAGGFANYTEVDIVKKVRHGTRVAIHQSRNYIKRVAQK